MIPQAESRKAMCVASIAANYPHSRPGSRQEVVLRCKYDGDLRGALYGGGSSMVDTVHYCTQVGQNLCLSLVEARFRLTSSLMDGNRDVVWRLILYSTVYIIIAWYPILNSSHQ